MEGARARQRVHPDRNRAGYLAQSMAAILGQSFEDIELIVSDNASSDETPDVVASFGDPRVRYLRNSADIGMMANSNRCVGLARAPYLVCTADDEQLYPDHLRRCVEVLDANPRVGMVHTAFDVSAQPARRSPSASTGRAAHRKTGSRRATSSSAPRSARGAGSRPRRR